MDKARPHLGLIVHFLIRQDLMLQSLVVLSLFLSSLIACSKDEPLPTAPAGKVSDFGLGSLLGSPQPSENTKVVEDTTTADDPFTIELVYLDSFSPKERQVISEAAYEWEQYIQAGFPEREGIDDLRIRVRTNTRASGSPCTDSKACVTLEGIRPTSYIPFDALLYIDLEPPWGYRDNEWIKRADRDYQRYIVTHEIGHALGLVGLRSVAFPLGLVHDNEDDDPYGIGGKPYFSGREAKRVFKEALALSPASYTGRGVPLDVRTPLRIEGIPNYRGPEHWPMQWFGTSVIADSHFMSSGEGVTQQGRLVTQLDLAVLSDLGYQVDKEEARPIEIGYYVGFRFSPSADRKTGTYSFGELIPPNETSAGKAIPRGASWCGNH